MEPRDLLQIASDEKKEEELKLPPWLVGRRFTKDHHVDKKAYEDMVVARSILLKDQPFWGILALGLTLVEDDQCILPTMATDGLHLIYNASFVRKLKKGELIFAIAHEIEHCIYKHVGGLTRRAGRHKRLWNIAGDYVINLELVKARVGKKIETIGILVDEKFDNMSTEEVYDYFIQHPDEVPDQGSFDLHIEIEVVPDDQFDGSQEGGGDPNSGKYRVRMKQSDFEKMDAKWKQQVVQAASAQKEHDDRTGNSAGNLPAFVQRMLEDLATPRINWRHALQRYVRAVLMRGYSYDRPHKATFHTGLTIPGFRTRKNELDCAVCIDTSGSVSQAQLAVFLGELDGIMQSFGAFHIKAWVFEGTVNENSVTDFKKHGSGTWDDIKKFLPKVTGGGGTNYEDNWRYMKENRIKPRLLLMLTDGYPVGSWGDPGYCPTIFMMFGNAERTKPPFGIGIHYEDETHMEQ